MKNEKIWESYVGYTEKTSNIVRWLSSILFGFGYLQELYFLLIMLMVLFAIDFLQYFIPSIMYKRFINKKEEKCRKEQKSINDLQYEVPISLDNVALTCWRVKIAIFFATLVSILFYYWNVIAIYIISIF